MPVFCLAKIHHRKEFNYVPVLRKSIMVKWMETSNNQGARYNYSAIGWTIRKFLSISCQWQRLFSSLLHINRLRCLAKFLCDGYIRRSLPGSKSPELYIYFRHSFTKWYFITHMDSFPYLHISASTHTVFYQVKYMFELVTCNPL
jgi:hypothetical protein